MPFLHTGLWPEQAQVDRLRVLKAWRGEDVVWSHPNVWQECRWREGDTRVLAIQGEHLERYDIYHIGENEYVWGPHLKARFPERRIVGLLDAWLGHFLSLFTQASEPEEFQLRVPDSRVECTAHVTLDLQTQPITWSAIPCRGGIRAVFDALSNGDESALPPSSRERPLFDSNGLPAFAPSPGPWEHVICSYARWPIPLRPLLFPGASYDDVDANARIREIALESSTDPQGACEHALREAEPYLSAATSTVERAFLGPQRSQWNDDANAVLDEIRIRYGVEANSLEELDALPQWHRIRDRPVPVWRAWGPVGLMFALLIERLSEQYSSFVQCHRCGRFIRGTKRRQFCRASDNPDCFRERQRAWKRQSLRRMEHIRR
jgi:hypothetical protein